MVIDTLPVGASANFKEYEKELPSTTRGSFGRSTMAFHGKQADAPLAESNSSAQLVHVVPPASDWYVPAEQREQDACPVKFAIDPGSHLEHSHSVVIPGVELNRPAGQSMQAVTLSWNRAEVPSSVKYFPTGQLVQLAAPGSLYLPAVQIKQVATLEAVEYFPGVHGVQVVAPVPVPVSVIDPALQLVQAATLETVEYLPLTQPRHIRSALFVPFIVTN
jgi:hypothetical protein